MPNNQNQSIKQAADWPVRVVRSHKRKKTISAQLEKGELVVRAPARISDKELEPIIAKLQAKLKKKISPAPQSDSELDKRAQELNKRYFDGRLKWRSIRYVTNQSKRYGSCSPSTATIRISQRVATLPKWVRDYVIVHEIAHLEEANHGPNFWALVNQYPLTERARGYLMALDLEDQLGE